MATLLSDMHLVVCEGEAPTLVCRSSGSYSLLTSPELDPGPPSPSASSTGGEARPAPAPKKRRDKVCQQYFDIMNMNASLLRSQA